ncbi:PorP/SprF family type IX secretion system membrane protein [Lewinella sp. IMCC34183]|uniref:PorP/SprF family type IX secretion system membrane protein n=1 Tax=Lewinella sp. IMCC34183 TaxID=2248762 RepID=UPI000E241026|nr:PorP/SprF family type IX secretion system membrane protein [Lewinella sp. IMCC34183]
MYCIRITHVLIGCLLVLSATARAQDAGFHHLSATPMLTNPALTGVIDGGVRVTADYQERYSGLGPDASFTSLLAGADWRRPVGRNHYYGFGVQVQHDRGGSSDYVRSQGLVSGSYQQRLGSLRGPAGRGAHFLSAGTQVGLGQRGFDFNKLWFSEQYFFDPASKAAYLDRGAPTGEPGNPAGARTYLDVGAGVTWFGTFGDRSGAYAGLAAYHLNAPNISPRPGATDRLARRYVLHGGGELPLGTGYLSLLPAARVMFQGPSRVAQLGGSLRYTQREWREIALRLLSFAHLNQADGSGVLLSTVTVGVGLEWPQVRAAVSYDLQAGPLARPANARSGFELSVIYTGDLPGRNRVFCPRF